jgi:hypothetical protein
MPAYLSLLDYHYLYLLQVRFLLFRIRVGDKKKRKKERNLWYSTMELIAKKILLISLVEMGVQGEVVQT